MLIKRAATALIGIPLLALILFADRIYFFALAGAAAALSSLELRRLLDRTPLSSLPIQAIIILAYIIAPFAFLIAIYGLRFGRLLVVCTLLATWIADTSAYAIGRTFGRRPLAPAVSPNKTAEGAAGSIIVAGLLLAAFTFMPVLTTAQRVVYGVVSAAAAVCGDLFESWLKRRAKVKDSGAILPGHGGLLDRLDSLLFTAPVSYLVFKLWI